MSERRHAPATERNRAPIVAVLREALPAAGLVLEVASGTGEHVAVFADAFPALTWQPSDRDADSRASIAAWCDGLGNVLPPLALDAAAPSWPISNADAIVCINMVHISPRPATEGLLAGGARLLPRGGALYLYGPYRREGVPTAPTNEAFDQSLKALSPDYGLRRLEDVSMSASARGLLLERVIEMPANNLSLIFRRT